ncbi:hypothetical protein STFR1_70157 [Bacillus vallismortis]
MKTPAARQRYKEKLAGTPQAFLAGGRYVWGMGAGCNGMIHIHAERITQEKRQYFARVSDCLHSGKTVTAVTKLDA